ncbi:DDE superfamily endonuclease [Popillia japonica]|uniref:DDE superfamily endonuclease n=1 Tax=Popillia japonica TaxID=7064 RepID=A0AAW1KMG0_POPJA
MVLLLNNCRAHRAASEMISGNISTTYLPPNVTSLIQFMDQGVIQNFKYFHRASFLQGLINSDLRKRFNIKDAIFEMALAWNKVKPTTLQKSWRKLWPKESWINIDHDVPVVEKITDQIITELAIENQQEFQPQNLETDDEEERTDALHIT